MSNPVPMEFSYSEALRLIVSQGWEWKGGEGGQVQVETCPFCSRSDWKFYVKIEDPQVGNRDGLFLCHHASCGATGNIHKLREKAGVAVAVSSHGGGRTEKLESLPNVEECHSRLLGDAEVMDYLINVRGFTEDAIKHFKLGVKEKQFFRKVGDQKAVLIPYLMNNSIMYAKYRTIPPVIKDFISPSGYDVPLFNGEILKPGLEEIIFVEGEYDALSCYSHGITNVVGVPGANFRKAEWIKQLDEINPARIYILYDTDSAGKRGAQELASRIGIERCLRIALTDKVKDIGEWFLAGHTAEEFEELKKNAHLFDVTGVMSEKDTAEQLREEVEGKADLAPKYVTKWKSFNRLVGFEDGDVIDILAPEKTGKTDFALNLIDDMVERYDEDGLFVCLEMAQTRLGRRWISKVTDFEDILVEAGTPEAAEQRIKFLEAIEKAKDIKASRKGTLYFAYPQGVKSPEDVYKLIIDCIRRYGVKWVVVDNLQLLCDMTLENKAHRTIHLSQISKNLSKLTKDYHIKMLRVLQPHQIGENEVIQTRHTDGSSQIRKDCDCMITLWRNPTAIVKKSDWDKGYVPGANASFEPRMKVTVGLSRYSAGGDCELHFDGARSQIREEAPKLDIPQYNAIIPTGASVPTEEGI